LNAALDFAFYRFGIWGIPLSTSLVNIAGSVALMIMLRRKIGGLDIGAALGSVVRISLASVVLAGVAYGVWWPLDHQLGQRFVAQAVSLGAALAVGAAVYLGLCKLLHVEELGALRLLRRSRTET
jgi:putative peptidoglycan lipid II flippase